MFRIEQKDAAQPPKNLPPIRLLVSDCPNAPTSYVELVLKKWVPLMHPQGVISVMHNSFLELETRQNVCIRQAGEQFLREFVEHSILDYSEPADLVVDPFCGQYNITGKLCMLHHRSYYGCDLFPLEMLDGTDTSSRLTNYDEYLLGGKDE